jgi:prepilin-type N-terminal cleavage/methylation domain-containing protein
MLKDQKGFTFTEMIVVLLLMSVVSLFVFQAYLYIHKRFIEWENDNRAAMVIMRLTQGLEEQIGRANKLIIAENNGIELRDTRGVLVKVEAKDRKLLVGDRNMLSDGALLQQADFGYFSNGKPEAGGNPGSIDCVTYALVFSHGKKVYSCKGSIALRRLNTFNTAGTV